MRNFLIGLCLLCSVQLMGQVNGFHIMRGINASNVDFDLLKENKFNRYGITLGAGYEYLFPSKIALGVDVIYSQEGSWTEQDIITANGNQVKDADVRYNLNYAHFPIKAGVVLGQRFKLSLYGAIVPGYLVYAEYSEPFIFYNQGVAIDKMTHESFTSKMDRFHLSGMGEMTLAVRIDKGYEVFATAMYRKGLTKFQIPRYLDNEEHTNETAALNFGVRYRFLRWFPWIKK